MSYFLDGNAGADAVVDSETLGCLIWKKEQLDELAKKNPPLYHKFKDCISLSLVKKIEETCYNFS